MRDLTPHRGVTPHWGEEPGAQQLEFGELMSKAARKLLEEVPAETHAARIEAMRALARDVRLAWSELHLLADLRKGVVPVAAVRLLKHARRDFGLPGNDAAVTAAYNDLAQQVVADGEALVRPHHGRLQYAFGLLGERAIAIVDFEEMRLVGLYGHANEAAFAKGWARGYVAIGARIVRGGV